MIIIKDYNSHLADIKRYVDFYRKHIIIDDRLPYDKIELIPNGIEINLWDIHYYKNGKLVVTDPACAFPEYYISIDLIVFIENSIVTWGREKSKSRDISTLHTL